MSARRTEPVNLVDPKWESFRLQTGQKLIWGTRDIYGGMWWADDDGTGQRPDAEEATKVQDTLNRCAWRALSEEVKALLRPYLPHVQLQKLGESPEEQPAGDQIETPIADPEEGQAEQNHSSD